MLPDAIPISVRPRLSRGPKPPNTFYLDDRSPQFLHIVAWLQERGYELEDSFLMSHYVTLDESDVLLFLMTF